jgi:hypothetical protein
MEEDLLSTSRKALLTNPNSATIETEAEKSNFEKSAIAEVIENSEKDRKKKKDRLSAWQCGLLMNSQLMTFQ